MSIKIGKPLVKIHGLGINSFNIWKRYPFYSVDASSWTMGARFRRSVKFKEGRVYAYNKGSKISIEKLGCYKNSYIKLNIDNMNEYQKATDFITEVWKKRGINWDIN